HRHLSDRTGKSQQRRSARPGLTDRGGVDVRRRDDRPVHSRQWGGVQPRTVQQTQWAPGVAEHEGARTLGAGHVEGGVDTRTRYPYPSSYPANSRRTACLSRAFCWPTITSWSWKDFAAFSKDSMSWSAPSRTDVRSWRPRRSFSPIL